MFHVGDVIRKLREQRGWTIEDLSEKTGVNKNTISLIERGEGNPRASTLADIGRVFDVPVSELYRMTSPLQGVEEPAGEHRSDGDSDFVDVTKGYVPDALPVIFEGEASPHGSLFWDNEGKLLPRITDRISRPTGVRDKNAYGVRVRGDSMKPKYEPGDVVLVSPNVPVRSGLRCYVQLKSGERLIKQVRKTIGGWMLESINQVYEPREVGDEEIDFMHPIVWSREIAALTDEQKIVDELTGKRIKRKTQA